MNDGAASFGVECAEVTPSARVSEVEADAVEMGFDPFLAVANFRLRLCRVLDELWVL